MNNLEWDREKVITQIREDIWRYLSPESHSNDHVLLVAAALLQMPAAEVRTLAMLQFVLGQEVGGLLDAMPAVLRRLATTTVHEEERSAERVRGAIHWGPTIAARISTGADHVYVTAPARRAFQTPENELLVYVLQKVVEVGRRTGWHRSSSKGAGDEVRRRVALADRALRTRSLSSVLPAAPSANNLMRVRTGRHRRRYLPVLSAHAAFRRYVLRLDRDAVRRAVEEQALISATSPVLFELMCLFLALRSLEVQGWKLSPLGLLTGGGARFEATRRDEALAVFYQGTPKALALDSIYKQAQQAHAIRAGQLRPDLVIKRSSGSSPAWMVVEIKGVSDLAVRRRGVRSSARAAIRDLLLYRRAFDRVLSAQEGFYGLGIAWGEGLSPTRTAEGIALCTPDEIPAALKIILDPGDASVAEENHTDAA